MKIYTKTGDAGETSLFGGGRVKKNHPRVAAYGEIDELNSFIGVLAADIVQKKALKHVREYTQIIHLLHKLQNNLFDLGAELATGDDKFLAKLPRRVGETDISTLEQAIDDMQAHLTPLKNFILPGGGSAAAHAHLCRSVARRAERAMIESKAASGLLITYINRLSDYFFVLARYLNFLEEIQEPEWQK